MAAPEGRPPKGKKSAGVQGTLRKPGTLLAVGGAGLVVVIALARRSAGGGSGASGSSTTGTATSPTYSGAYDSTVNDLYNSIEPQIEALQGAIQTISKTPGPAGPTGPAGPKGATGPRGPAGKPPAKKKPVKKKKPVRRHHHR